MRLSHSMAPGPSSLHSFAMLFKEAAERATAGAVTVRVFPSGTLGQEREVVQQLQEGLVDFMCSGTAIWSSVAPKLSIFDFPFMWRNWDHVHRVTDGAVGREAAEYLAGAVRMRPLAWGDSFGFRHVITRASDITDTRQLASFEHAQQLGLHRCRQLADFVEEQGAAPHCLERAFAQLAGARECAALVAEQLAFHQAFGQCGAIERQERLFLAA